MSNGNEQGIRGLNNIPDVIYDQFGLPVYIPTGDEEPLLTPAQTAYLAGQFPFGAATVDATGKMAEMPSRDVTMEQLPQHMLTGERAPSLAENLSRGGFGGYGSAVLQSLGLAGDALYAAPVVGPVLGATVGTSLKGIANLGKVGKAVRAASKSDEGIAALKTDVDMFARDDSGFISPTIQALIEKAPANLKGQQITEWANANANKGVKPKELEFLGLDEFVDANPSATTREAVEGISGNKVRVSQNVRSGEGKTLEFESTIPETDPLDGSNLYEYRVEDLKYQLEQGDELIKEQILDFHQEQDRLKSSAGIMSGYKSFDEIPQSEIDDIVEAIAEDEYYQNPYEMLTPQGERFGSGTFAFGNDNVGYSLFVDGQRVTDNDNIAYSRTEAEIQLQQKMGLEDYGLYGETQFKRWVDQSLPGGENYREVVFNWDNAPEAHHIGHFDDENQIAHALIRDRILDDGTPSLHIDELQSDLHTAGSREGYRIPPKQREEIYRKLEDYLKDNKTFKFEHILGEPGILNTTDNTFTTFEMLSDSRHYLKKYDPYRQQVTLRDLMEIDEFVDIIEPILDEGSVPDYPFKDNWHEMVLKNLLLDAAREGKPALSVSGSAPIKERYSEQYSNFYEMLYDRKVPSFMKKLANRYGGEFEQGRLDYEDTFDEIKPFIDEVESVDANIIRITPEMRERILEEGIPSFGAGGIVDITQGTDPSMVDRVGNFMKERM
tara:strand:- start:128 stop:2293 length:2166 start_codon:yes stop_codon:yes gene_type:complete